MTWIIVMCLAPLGIAFAVAIILLWILGKEDK